MKKLALCGLLALLAFVPPAHAQLIRFQDTDGSNRVVAPPYPLPTVAGGREVFSSPTTTVQNAQYVSGNCMGGFQNITAARATGGSGILNTLIIASKGGGTTALTLYVFTSNPSASTCTDKSTFTLAAADISKLIYPPTSITPSAPTGTTVTIASITNMAASYITSGDANLYFAIVSGGTWTPASTSDLVLIPSGMED